MAARNIKVRLFQSFEQYCSQQQLTRRPSSVVCRVHMARTCGLVQPAPWVGTYCVVLPVTRVCTEAVDGQLAPPDGCIDINAPADAVRLLVAP